MSIIYWDFDGTLTYSNPLWSNSVYNALKEIAPNNNVEFADIRKCMASGFTWHSPDNDYSSIKNDEWWNFMNDKIRRDCISFGVDEVTATRAALLVRKIIKRVENYTLYPDAISVLKALHAGGNKNIILSNNHPDLIEVIEALEISEFFDDYIISAVEGYDKPRAELFERAKSLNIENLPMYMIGDSKRADILGGNNAGMTTILVHNGYCEEADYCCESLKKILDIIK